MQDGDTGNDFNQQEQSNGDEVTIKPIFIVIVKIFFLFLNVFVGQVYCYDQFWTFSNLERDLFWKDLLFLSIPHFNIDLSFSVNLCLISDHWSILGGVDVDVDVDDVADMW